MKSILMMIGALLACPAHAAEPLLAMRAKLATEEERGAFDTKMDTQLGDGVMARLAAAAADTSATESEELAKLYMEDKLKDSANGRIEWDKVLQATRLASLKHMASKTVLNAADLGVAERMPFTECPELKARQNDLLSLIPKSELRRYSMKYVKLLGVAHVAGSTYLEFMTPQELMNVTAGTFTAPMYDRIRKEMLARCIKEVTRTRRKANLSTKAAAIDEAMVPILAALNAPLWEGLTDAMQEYGDALVAPDYTDLVACLTKQCEDLDSRRIDNVNKVAGALMFWKGVQGYKTWTEQYK